MEMEQNPMTTRDPASFDAGCTRVAADPLTVFEQNIGDLRPIEADLLQAWCIERGGEVVIAAIELAVKRGGRSSRYVEGILKEWARAGITTLEQKEAYEQKKCGNIQLNGGSVSC